jgi:hypothetical protein
LALLLRSALCDLKASSPSSRNEGVPCVPRSQRASVAGQARTMAVALARQTIASAARGAPIQLPCKQKIPREPRTRAIAVSASATGGLRNSYWHDAEKPLIGHQFPSAPPRAPAPLRSGIAACPDGFHCPPSREHRAIKQNRSRRGRSAPRSHRSDRSRLRRMARVHAIAARLFRRSLIERAHLFPVLGEGLPPEDFDFRGRTERGRGRVGPGNRRPRSWPAGAVWHSAAGWPAACRGDGELAIDQQPEPVGMSERVGFVGGFELGRSGTRSPNLEPRGRSSLDVRRPVQDDPFVSLCSSGACDASGAPRCVSFLMQA